MQVILTQDVDKLGYRNDVIKVKAGYARNYLIPQGFAKVANASNMRAIEEIHRQQARKRDQLLQQIQSVVDKLATAVIKVGAKVGTTEKIFGSVTTHHIAEAIKKEVGIDVDRRKIHILDKEVKTLGTYKARVDLHPEHQPEISFEVVAE